MNDDRVERMLRRASDDVRATVVRSADPPPIDDLDRSQTPRMVTFLSLLLLVGGAWLTVTVVRDEVPAPAQPPPTPSPLQPTPAMTTAADLCSQVVEITKLLTDPPTSVGDWTMIGDELDTLATRVGAANPSESVARRYERFIVLARQAVDLGEQSGFTPAKLRADNAVAVAVDLIGFVDVPGCDVPTRPTSQPGD